MLVTRPLPAAHDTAARLVDLGHDVLVSPLLVTEALAWELPMVVPQAVVFTSANGPKRAGVPLGAYLSLPAFAVGDATAAAARKAGCVDIRTASGDASAVFAQAAAAGFTRLLHLAGEDRSDAVIPPGVAVTVRSVYRARLAGFFTPDALDELRGGGVDVVLLYSARTAAHFAALVDQHGLARGGIVIAALSSAIAAAAGPGWRRIAVAATPREDALLAAAGLLLGAPSAGC